MGGNRSLIPRLVAALHRLGLAEFAALMLEAGQPLAPLGAQLSYLAEPLLGGSGGPLREVGQLLEDPRQLDRLLRELQAGEARE